MERCESQIRGLRNGSINLINVTKKKNEILLKLKEVLSKSIYKGPGIDIHNASITVHLFEIYIKGEPSWIISREIKGEGILIHSISDSAKILKALNQQ